MEPEPQNPRKQIMRNSFEQAKSRRHLTANVENKWFSNLHENVNSAMPNTYENPNKWFSNLHENVNSAMPDASGTQNKWFSNLHENVNSAILRNANVPSGTLLEERKRYHRCQGHYRSTPSVLKWLPISSQIPTSLRISLNTLICLPKPFQTPSNLRPTLYAHSCLWIELIHLGPTRSPFLQKYPDSITLLVPFQRLQVMCSTRSKLIPLRTC